MHKEEVIISPRKPRTSIRASAIKTEHQPAAELIHANFHTRLPSTDSGIQADGGFDSLSRYKGKTFLYSGNDHVTSERFEPASIPGGGGQSAAQSPKVLSISSQSFVASSKPTLPVKPTMTSHPPKSSLSGSKSGVTPVAISSQTQEIQSPKPSIKAKPASHAKLLESSSCMSRQPGNVDRNPETNHIIGSSPKKNVANQKTELNLTPSNRKQGSSLTANQKFESECNVTSSVKVVATDAGVEISFPKIASLSSHPSSPASPCASPTTTTTVLSVDPGGGTTVTVTESKVRMSTTNIFSAPGTALKLQVTNSVRPSQGQIDSVRNQGQGCVALTQPLKLGAPPKMNVKAVQPTSLSPQPQHLVPVLKSQQQQQSALHIKAKPKIAPRPSVLAKSSSPPQTRMAVSATAGDSTITSALSEPRNNIASRKVTSPDSSHKSKIHLGNRVRIASPTSGRTEIPVTHVVQRAPSNRIQAQQQQQQQHQPPPPPLYSRPQPPSSFLGRTPPESDNHQNGSPLYENLRFDLRDGLDFHDHDNRLKHVLRQSDELINDALKMLGSPKATDVKTPTGAFAEGSRIVEGAECTSEREHRIPILDVRTGKLHGGVGGNTSWSAAWPEGQGSSAKVDGKQEVTWTERKERMDAALRWLKHQLADLRDMDNTIISQFRRCQDTIESLKTQRDVWEGLSEEGEEGDYWDDYELNEYNRRYLDSPGGSSPGRFSQGSREPSLQDMTLVSLHTPELNSPQDGKTAGLTQDIEATL